MRAHHRDENGFTLIELLVVVVIIGILAALAVPTFLRQREKGWRAGAVSDMKNAALAIESQATEENGNYATANGITQTSSVLTSQGFNASSWADLSCRGRHRRVLHPGADGAPAGPDLHLLQLHRHRDG